MGAAGGVVQGLTDEVKKLFDPVVKLNKRQALTQSVNLGVSLVVFASHHRMLTRAVC